MDTIFFHLSNVGESRRRPKESHQYSLMADQSDFIHQIQLVLACLYCAVLMYPNDILMSHGGHGSNFDAWLAK